MKTLDPETPFQAQEFLKAFHYTQRGMGEMIQLRGLRFLHRDKKWWESVKTAHLFAENYVDQALEFRKEFLVSKDKNGARSSDDDGKHRYILLHEMAKETDNRDDLRNQIIHVFLAGHDSSAITIGHAIFHLSRNPEIWRKLHAEVSTSTGNFTFESLKNLHYLQYIIRESMTIP